jgi:bifunctional DNase/RNase
MKRVTLTALTGCSRCRRAVAFLTTEDEERTLGIAFDPSEARELARMRSAENEDEHSLTALVARVLARSPHDLRRVILDCHREGFLVARIEVVSEGRTENFTCSPAQGVLLGATTRVPMYVAKGVFERDHVLSHHAIRETEATDSLGAKRKPVLQ